MPVSASRPYDRFGERYNISRVIDIEHYSLNVTAYENYSQLYLPATYAMTYLIAFSISTSILVHTALYHGPALLAGFKNARVEEDDIHAKLMRAYPEVPDWWYVVIGAIFFALAMVTALVSSIFIYYDVFVSALAPTNVLYFVRPGQRGCLGGECRLRSCYR